MADIKTTYMGLSLKSPLIAGSSGLTNDLDGIRQMEEQGIGKKKVGPGERIYMRICLGLLYLSGSWRRWVTRTRMAWCTATSSRATS